jgi:phenylalanyl-tRNA synthetase beta chain
MKFSEQWLREWVDPKVSTAKLAHRLTMAGLEVDSIDPVAGDFSNVVVGEILEIEQHPDADKLRVCMVDVGKKDLLKIVCGAANAEKGLRAPVALVGAVLPGGLKIKKGKLRGVDSFGMLCSEQELGMAESADGLMVLPADATPGADIRDYLGLDDVSIELGLTPNRGDCLGIAGIAREVGVLFGLDVEGPQIDPMPADHRETFPVEIQSTDDCPHYIGRVIKDINAGVATPLWMQEKLRRSGLRSLGPVVDVTNYVLLELGQPMHAFDLKKLQGGLWVRRAIRNESLVLLGGNKIALDSESLVIADVKGPQALAGIMGGQASAVSDSSKHIFLESAFFAPLPIAGRARRFGLHTASSHRFERGVDPKQQRRAIERATALLLSIVGGKAGPVIEVTDRKTLPDQRVVTLRAARVARVLGTPVENKKIEDILVHLGMQLSSEAEGVWQVRPPSFRFDISIEEDLIEEIGRIYGYDQLPTRHGMGAMMMSARAEACISPRRLRSRLVDRGYQEVINYSFIDPAQQERFDNALAPVKLSNPLASDMAVMRTSLLPGLVASLKYNLNRQQDRLLLFEQGIKYIQQDTDIKEEDTIAGIVYGTVLPEHWDSPARAMDFFDVKADVEALLALALATENWRFEALEASNVFHPGQSARIFSKNGEIGRIGALHPALCAENGLPEGIFAFELSLEALKTGKLPNFTPVSRHPAIRRDLAIVVKEGVSAQDIDDCIREASGEWLIKLQLFDLYKGKGIDSGEKSLALGLTLQASSRTLMDTEVDGVVEKVLASLNKNFNATLRD